MAKLGFIGTLDLSEENEDGDGGALAKTAEPQHLLEHQVLPHHPASAGGKG